MPINYFKGFEDTTNVLRDIGRNEQATNQQALQNTMADRQMDMNQKTFDRNQSIQDMEVQLKMTGMLFKFAGTLEENPSPEVLEGTKKYFVETFGPEGLKIAQQLPPKGTPPNEVKNWAMEKKNFLAGIYGQAKDKLHDVAPNHALFSEATGKPVFRAPGADSKFERQYYKTDNKGGKITRSAHSEEEAALFEKEGFKRGDFTPAKPSKDDLSKMGKWIKERDKHPEGSAARKFYDDKISKETQTEDKKSEMTPTAARSKKFELAKYRQKLKASGGLDDILFGQIKAADPRLSAMLGGKQDLKDINAALDEYERYLNSIIKGNNVTLGGATHAFVPGQGLMPK
jgi:hypothetical protein